MCGMNSEPLVTRQGGVRAAMAEQEELLHVAPLVLAVAHNGARTSAHLAVLVRVVVEVNA